MADFISKLQILFPNKDDEDTLTSLIALTDAKVTQICDSQLSNDLKRSSLRKLISAAPALPPPGQQVQADKKRLRSSSDAQGYELKKGQEAKDFETALKKVKLAPVGQSLKYPEFPMLRASKQTRFAVDANHEVYMVHRKVSDDLYQFITKNFGKKPAIYIHGPQGVGKSHSLFEAVMQLMQIATNRVIYIPDCGGWGDATGSNIMTILLDAIVLAFPNDQDILDACKATTLDEFSITALLDELPSYCRKNGLSLYGVFDQHNGLREEQRVMFPYKIVEAALPSSPAWKESALIVVSASANNTYHLKVASDSNWPEFVMEEGYTDDEWTVVVTDAKFFTNADMTDVKYWTRQIPYELSRLVEARDSLVEQGQNPLLDDVLKVYLEKRKTQLNAQQRRFFEQQLVQPELKGAALKAVLDMKLRLTASPTPLLNQQLMYLKKDLIYPTTPLAEQVLVSFWNADYENSFYSTVESILSGPLATWPADTKGRVLEKYIIHQLEKYRSIQFSVHEIDNKIKKSFKKKAIKLSFKEFSVIKFDGNSTPGKVDWKSPALFVPNITNYPDVDLLLWNPAQETLLAIQITVHNPVKAHGNKFFQMGAQFKPSDLWAHKITTEFGKTPTILFLWIASNDLVDSSMDSQYFLQMDKLDAHFFPLVEKLVV